MSDTPPVLPYGKIGGRFPYSQSVQELKNAAGFSGKMRSAAFHLLIGNLAAFFKSGVSRRTCAGLFESARGRGICKPSKCLRPSFVNYIPANFAGER